MLGCFLAGVAILFARDLRVRGEDDGSWRLGIMFLLPFAAVWGASLVGVYPYVGSRHTVVLAPFAIGAASFLLAAVSRKKLWAGLLLAAALMGAANTSAKPVEIGVAKGNDSPALMAGAMAHMEQSIPRGSLILVDFQSSLPMTYYLCGPKTIIPSDTFQGEYFRFELQRVLRGFAAYLEVDRGKFSDAVQANGANQWTEARRPGLGVSIGMGNESGHGASEARCKIPVPRAEKFRRKYFGDSVRCRAGLFAVRAVAWMLRHRLQVAPAPRNSRQFASRAHLLTQIPVGNKIYAAPCFFRLANSNRTIPAAAAMPPRTAQRVCPVMKLPGRILIPCRNQTVPTNYKQRADDVQRGFHLVLL